MKKNITYIDAAKFSTIVTEMGLVATDQAGFTKVDLGNGRQLYVARTKRVGRVDLSCLTSTCEGVRDLGGESFGNVRQQLDFSRTEEQVLATFRAVLEEGRTQPRYEAPKRTQPGTVKAKAEAPASSPEDAAERKAARKALLMKVAAEKGASISANADIE